MSISSLLKEYITSTPLRKQEIREELLKLLKDYPDPKIALNCLLVYKIPLKNIPKS